LENLYIFRALIVLILIIGTSRILGTLCLRIGQPRIIGEMLAGVFLGPTLMGQFFPQIHSTLFSDDIRSSLYLLSNLGLSFYMFIIGLEFQTKQMSKRLYNQSIVFTLTGFFVPMILAFILAILLQEKYLVEGTNKIYFTLFIGICLATTAFPMIARVLKDKGISNTDKGKVLIFSASLMDIVGWVCLALMTTLLKSNSILGGIYTFLALIVMVTLLFYLIKPLITWIINGNNNNINHNLLALIFIMIMLCSAATDLIGMHSIFGGFILGLIMPKENAFIENLNLKIHDFIVVFFLPMFFTYSGINTTITPFNLENIMYFLIIFLFAFGGKYITCLLTGRSIGYSWPEASSIGALMNARGLIELIVLNVGLVYGIITQDLFNLFVWMAIATTAMAMPIYELSYKTKNVKSEKIRRKEISDL